MKIFCDKFCVRSMDELACHGLLTCFKFQSLNKIFYALIHRMIDGKLLKYVT